MHSGGRFGMDSRGQEPSALQGLCGLGGKSDPALTLQILN